MSSKTNAAPTEGGDPIEKLKNLLSTVRELKSSPPESVMYSARKLVQNTRQFIEAVNTTKSESATQSQVDTFANSLLSLVQELITKKDSKVSEPELQAIVGKILTVTKKLLEYSQTVTDVSTNGADGAGRDKITRSNSSGSADRHKSSVASDADRPPIKRAQTVNRIPSARLRRPAQMPPLPNNLVNANLNANSNKEQKTANLSTSGSLSSRTPDRNAERSQAAAGEISESVGFLSPTADDQDHRFRRTSAFILAKQISNDTTKAIEKMAAAVAGRSKAEFVNNAKPVLELTKAIAAEFQSPVHSENVKKLDEVCKQMVNVGRLVVYSQPGGTESEFNELKDKALTILKLMYSTVGKSPVTAQPEAAPQQPTPTQISSSSNNVPTVQVIDEGESTELHRQYCYVTTILPFGSDFAPVIKQNKTNFWVEPETKKFRSESYALDVRVDVYQRDFFKIGHWKFVLSSTQSGKLENSIIVVRETPRFNFFPGLTITKKGWEEFLIPDQGAASGKVKFKIHKFLMQKFQGDTVHYIRDDKGEAAKDIVKIEIDSPQTKTDLKVGIIYCKKGQSNPHDMFKNDVSSDLFKQFLKDMQIAHGKKEDTIRWKHVNVTFYNSPYCNAEEHRRLVGNAPSIIFFKEDNEPFDAAEVDKLGMVPQIFIVVQPHKNQGYRLGFFNSGNLRPFGPELPANHIWHPDTLQDYVLSKIHNGNVMFFYCSPMNRAFTLTRTANIDRVLEKHLTKKYS